MATRTTIGQIEGAFELLKYAANKYGIDTDAWSLDHHSGYGGWCIETRYGRGNAGGHGLSANRMPAQYFYQALRMAEDLFNED